MPSDSFRLRAELLKGLNGAGGVVGMIGADKIWRSGDQYMFSIGPRLLLSDARFQRAYFGVSPAASLATGLPTFRPKSGVYGVALASGASYQFSTHWGVFGYARYERLVGDDELPLGAREEAVACYRRALELRPGMAEALNNLGNALRATGDSEGAMEAYRQALTQRSIYPEAHNNLGALLQQDGKFEDAEGELRTAIAQNPRYIEAHNNLAQLLSSRKRDVEALAVLGEALKLGPDLQTLVLTAKVQLGRGNLEAAEQAARLALEIDQESAAALTVLGQLLHDKDRYDEALEVLGQALKAAPDHAEALNFNGVALKSVGRLDEARAHIVKALELNPAMYGAYANLGDLVDFSCGSGAVRSDAKDFRGSAGAGSGRAARVAFRFCQGAGRPRRTRTGARPLCRRRPDQARRARI
jgi:tetratricopeptide (TPR) repeat protein